MSFNSASEAEKCIEMSLKWSFFIGGEEEEEEEEGGDHPLVQVNISTFLDQRRPKTSGVVAKEQRGGASK